MANGKLARGEAATSNEESYSCPGAYAGGAARVVRKPFIDPGREIPTG